MGKTDLAVVYLLGSVTTQRVKISRDLKYSDLTGDPQWGVYVQGQKEL